MIIQILFMQFYFVCMVNAGNMVVEMATMMASQFAGSAANQTVTSEFNDMSLALQNGQSDIERALSNFSQQAQSVEKETLKNSFALLSKAQNNVSAMLTAQQTDFSKMLSYVQSTISRQLPLQSYVQSPVLYDQIFTSGRMLTPEGYNWYNLFPIGNWEYDQTSNSFWQMTCMPINVTSQVSVDNIQNVINNLIFTEWYPHQTSYQLEFEISLYQYVTPCFIGVYFNRSRWISGDISTFQRGRVLGLMVSDTNMQQCCFAESFSTITGENVTWNFPITQILNPSSNTQLKTSVPENIFVNGSGQHAIFRIKLMVQAGQVQYKIWALPSAEPAQYQSIKNLNKDLFLYHGIGFISAGCMAEFKIIQPEALIFSSQAIDAFDRQLKKEIQVARTQSGLQSINAIVGVS